MTTKTLTLTDFLLSRIAEDEAAACKAEQGRWKLWGMQVMADPKGTSDVDDCIPVADPYTPSWCERVPRTWNASHIARHDPARVLVECESKRRIVEAHGREHECISLTGSGERSVVDGKPWALWELEHTDAGPCFVLRCLALPYVNHPDYNPNWRP